MANLFLGWGNRIDAGTLSGGSWLAGLPLAYLQDRQQWMVARSTNALLASTRFVLDLGAPKTLRAFALINHNLSAAATWRVVLSSDAGATSVIADTAWQAVWHLSFDADEMSFESMNLWEGAVDVDQYTGHPYHAAHVLAEGYSARYVTIEINDTANADGFVQIGRAFVGDGFQPTYNAAYGLRDYWIDPTEILEMQGKNEEAIEYRRRKGVSFVLEHHTHNEAAVIHEMQRRLGKWGEILYVPDTADQESAQRYGIFGRMEELSPIDYPKTNSRSTGFRIKEL